MRAYGAPFVPAAAAAAATFDTGLPPPAAPAGERKNEQEDKSRFSNST